MTLDQQYSYLSQRVDRALAALDAAEGDARAAAQYEVDMLLAVLDTVYEAKCRLS